MMKDMKKYIVLLFMAVLALPACNEMLDLRDNGTTDMSQVFTDRDKTRGYINSCYNLRGRTPAKGWIFHG